MLPDTLARDKQAAPLIRDSDLAPEKSRIWGDVDGVLLERSERNDVKRPLMGGRQHHVGGRAVIVRPQPVQSGHAPAVAGREPGEVVLRHRGDQVIADTTLVLEERGRDHRADRVAPPVLRTGTTAPVTVKAGEGVDATRLKLATEHITIGHRTSIAWQASRRRAPEALAARLERAGERPLGWRIAWFVAQIPERPWCFGAPAVISRRRSVFLVSDGRW